MLMQDGSASATLNCDSTWTYERKIAPEENEYGIRNDQVNQRVRECEETFNLLRRLSEGHVDESLLNEPPNTEFITSLKHLDLDTCFISGHSFGGATALKALYTSRYI